MFDEKGGPYDSDELKTAKQTLLLFHQVSVIIGLVIIIIIIAHYSW